MFVFTGIKASFEKCCNLLGLPFVKNLICKLQLDNSRFRDFLKWIYWVYFVKNGFTGFD